MKRKVFIYNCRKIIKNEGRCASVSCSSCPFYYETSGCVGRFCNSGDPSAPDKKLVESCRTYLRKNNNEIAVEL